MPDDEPQNTDLAAKGMELTEIAIKTSKRSNGEERVEIVVRTIWARGSEKDAEKLVKETYERLRGKYNPKAEGCY